MIYYTCIRMIFWNEMWIEIEIFATSSNFFTIRGMTYENIYSAENVYENDFLKIIDIQFQLFMKSNHWY